MMKKNIKKILYKYQDLKYQEFNKKIIPGIDNIIGVRKNDLVKISKTVKLDDLTNDTYEEIIIKGILISKIKDINILKKEITNYIPNIDNWSTCDSFVSSLKITKDNLDEIYNLIINYKDGSCYEKRFLLVMLLWYYLNDDYIDNITNIILEIDYKEYYVMMAVAWLISKMYINYKNIVIDLFESNKLSKDLINKSISKINDSYLISKEDKLIINKYKI